MIEQVPNAHFSQGKCLLVEDHEQSMIFFKKIMEEHFPSLKILTARSLAEAYHWLQDQDAISDLRFALIDLGLPDGHGKDLIKELKRLDPSIISIVVTIFGDDTHLFEALAAGAGGYLLKDDPTDLFADTLLRITNGEPPLSPSIAKRLLSRFHVPSDQERGQEELTKRETETLRLIAQGLTVAEVASRLGLSAQTVAGYVKIVYQKLHVSNRARATHEAIRRGLI